MTAAWVPELTRETVFDAIAHRATYGTTCSRIYLDVKPEGDALRIAAASEDGLRELVIMRAGEPIDTLIPDGDVRLIETSYEYGAMKPDEYIYVRVVTEKENTAWSSPLWGDDLNR